MSKIERPQHSQEISVPEDSPLRTTMPEFDFEDAFQRSFSDWDSVANAEQLVHRLFDDIPHLAVWTLKAKDFFLKPLGFSPVKPVQFKWSSFGSEHRVGEFKDTPFTAHIALSLNRSRNSVILASRVRIHTTKGRVYLALIKPFHKIAFKYLLERL